MSVKIEHVLFGAAAIAASVYLYQQVSDRGYTEIIENNTKPPPVIRTPIGGEGPYGYFRPFWETKIRHTEL